MLSLCVPAESPISGLHARRAIGWRALDCCGWSLVDDGTAKTKERLLTCTVRTAVFLGERTDILTCTYGDLNDTLTRTPTWSWVLLHAWIEPDRVVIRPISIAYVRLFQKKKTRVHVDYVRTSWVPLHLTGWQPLSWWIDGLINLVDDSQSAR
jgi:hypothetical protein